jgi:SNF2 family DNA or RNA helicase
VALHLQRRKQIRHVLVLVPRKANKEEWKLEIEKHFPNLSYCIMPSETEAKHLMLGCSDALVTIETYSGLYYLACEKVKDQRRGRKGRNRLDVSPRLMRALTDKFDGIVLDESHGAKSKNKLPFRICNRIATNAKLVMALSATPLGRDPTDLWGQMRMVDGGETLGETLALFRAAFFSEQKDLFGTAKFIFKKSKSGLLNRILNNRSIRFEADEADLPKVVEIVKKFSLPEDAETYYRRAVTTMRESVGNYREQKNAWLRMRQISSGFVGFKDDDTGKSAQFTFPDNPKLELLLTLLESVDDKAIVFYEYTWSGLRIIKELHRLGIGALHLYGKTKDQGGARRRFNDDPNVRVLVMQNSFGEGLNLQAAKYGFFYESPVRPDVRKQCRRRFERQDSKHKHVFSYDLVCADSVDESILKAIKEGNDLFRQIIDGKAII